MKKIFTAAAVILMLAGMASCWQLQQEPEAFLLLENSLEDVVIEVGGGVINNTVTVQVNSNTRWKLNHSGRDPLFIPQWCVGEINPDPTQPVDTIGFGNNTMTIVIAPNDTPNEDEEFFARETALTIEMFDEYVGQVSRRVIIRQGAGNYSIALTGEGATEVENGIEMAVGADSGSKVVTVNANGAWEIARPQEIDFVKLPGNKYEFFYPENTTAQKREFEIVFSIARDSAFSTTLTLKQESVISVNSSGAVDGPAGREVTVGPNEGKVTVSVKSKAEWQVTLPEGITRDAPVNSNTTCVLSYPENNTMEDREFVIVFSLVEDPSISVTFTIKQAVIFVNSRGAVNGDKGKEVTVEAAAGEVVVSVEAIADWLVDCPEGIEYTIEDDECTLTYPENTSAKDRRFDIVFSIASTPSATANFTIIQKAAAQSD